MRGPAGLSGGTKLSAWSSLNGLPYKTFEDLANNIVFLGTSKNAYNALSTSTPQNGVAVRYKGIANLVYMAPPTNPTIIYPGEDLTFSIPKYSKRTFPLVTTRPSEKLVPTIEPFSFANLAQH